MSTILYIFTVLLAALCAAAAPAVPSSTPCTFTCPPTDQLGFALGQSNLNSNPIFCSYPAVEGEDPNDFFCTYDKFDGHLVQDNDAGLCVATAVQNCPTRRRRQNALPRSPYPPSSAARDVKPGVMKTRSELGAKKRAPGA